MSERVAIVGCGYVGAALARELCAHGHDVLATTTSPARVDELRSLGALPAVVELADIGKLHALLSTRTHVYLTVAPGGAERDYRGVYLEGVQNLLRACAGTSVRRVVYTSSTSVYGQDDGSWVEESSATEPARENGRILLAAERALLDGAAPLGITATILRLSGIYGPGRDPAERAVRSAGQTRDDGDVYVNLIHRDDVVAALVRLLDLEYDGILNLSDGRPILRREIYDRIIRARRLPSIQWIDQAAGGARGKRVCADLAGRVLGFTPRFAEYWADALRAKSAAGPDVCC